MTSSMLTDKSGELLPVEISRDQLTGKPVAAYVRVCEGKVADTKELVEGIVFADYDASEKLLGIELLAPCKDTFLAGMPPRESGLLRQFIDSRVWPYAENANGAES